MTIKRIVFGQIQWLLILVLITSGCVYYNTFYNARVYYREGLKLLATNPSAAKTNFEKSITKSAVVVKKHFRSKWADDALYLVGMSYYHIGEYNKAIKNFEDFLVVFPESPYRDEVNYYRGLAYLALKDYGIASLIFYDLKENSSRYATAAAYQIAYAFFQKEEYGVAKDSLLAFIQKYPKVKESKEAMRNLAEISFKTRDWSTAISWYRAYSNKVAMKPNEKAALNLKLAECFLQTRLLDSARILLAQDYSRFPDLINQANLLMGKLLIAEKKDELAIQYLTKLRTGNQGAEAYYLLGFKYETAQEFNKAIAYYDTASRFAPNSEFGLKAKKRSALLNLISPKAEIKDSAEAQFLLAETYGLTLNEYEAAVKEYQKTYDLYPQSSYAPKALYAQAWIMKNRLKQNDYDTILKILINNYPKTIYANAARKELGLPEIELQPEDTATQPVPKESVLKKEKLPAESLAIEKGPTPLKESLPDSVLTKPESVPSLKPKADFKESSPEIALKETVSKNETTQMRPKIEPKRRQRRREKLQPEIEPKPTEKETTGISLEQLAEKSESISTAGITSAISPIYFDFDRYDIRSADTVILKIIAQELSSDSTRQILIEGHCDPIGSEKYNYQLGLRRATAVKDYLVQLGVEPERISVKSFGEEKLISSDSLEYWKNRRCELVIKERND
ncbi:MAG: OmpA family protein [candidate division WOR-3 bacterium]